ncbi:threonine-phosphate decarboxylase CobD [Prosthecodimorpha staleyi]|uniref:threonine-phosphate decarboxylase n=1 Tax=Prosthecodimorpha staleyi TaxID=2840188 RepID=A0A947GFI9_9HYPH|nr:threonine-phosphate decarboxylase CobD [Prosthecodimorpha staleyi]MBT9292821.1 threonine-phosphate decarboxylase CobD [Prosthecodimorpha staleyi]
MDSIGEAGGAVASDAPGASGAVVLHGGDLATARRLHPQAPEPWIDLSTGINPVPYPVGAIAVEAWTRLPGRDAADRLIAAARVAYGAGPETAIVAAPGTQALIQRLPDLLPGPDVRVLGFTYQEHEAVWRRAGRRVERVAEAPALVGADVAVIVNPNNPDGRLIAPAALAEIARAVVAAGGTLVVDEAFMDVIRPEPGSFPAGLLPLRPAGTLVLRSFGKAYGLAGLRLGFALGDAALVTRLGAALGPWAVPGPALEIGARALADRAWLEVATARLEADAARLDRLLVGAGCTIVGGTPLFRLARHDDAANLHHRLAQAGILTRAFAEPTWLRFGLPGSEAAWTRLAAALAVRPGAGKHASE